MENKTNEYSKNETSIENLKRWGIKVKGEYEEPYLNRAERRKAGMRRVTRSSLLLKQSMKELNNATERAVRELENLSEVSNESN